MPCPNALAYLCTRKYLYQKHTRMHKFLLILLVSLSMNVHAQDSAELVRQANIRIDDYQKRFSKDLAPIKMDNGVKNLLGRFITQGTDSIQQVLKQETESPFKEQLLALNSHATFLDAFRYSVTTSAFEVYHIRDMKIKYLQMFDLIRHYQPYDQVMNTLG